ncbi:hypothetical protein BDW62DRAFT_196710 [Aspergillus aurantiobrunneus]
MAIDDNEVHPSTGPILPFVRALDGMKPADPAVALIAAGGVTTSLILPGSGNIIGGEAYVTKNHAAPQGEAAAEDMLLEFGIPVEQRRRYMKMACGENPMRVHGHTRLGHAWKLRQHLFHARSLRNQQDNWCQAAADARDRADYSVIAELTRPGQGYPEDIELASTVALLRGKVDAHIHCYETQDMETMIRHSQEFGFRIGAFHHALEAWKIPELIKAADQARSARYLLFQAAHAHSYGLSDALALGSITSVPARTLGLDHRIGHVRTGYDADLVVWDSHPSELGATPVQVYIDGSEVLGGRVVEETLSKKRTRMQQETQQQQRQLNITFDKSPTDETADGVVNEEIDPKDPASVVYAKDGVHLEGRAFDRARTGGVTRAITVPLKKRLLRGMSAGIKISGNTTDLDKRILEESVALHFAAGQTSKGTLKVPTISSAVQALRAILADNHGEENIYGMAARGKIPIIIHAENQYDIQRVLGIKEQPDINLILAGASEARLAVDKLTRLNVPVIITAPRGQPDTVEKKNMLVGPPLTASLVQALDEAGVQFAIADSGEGI